MTHEQADRARASASGRSLWTRPSVVCLVGLAALFLVVRGALATSVVAQGAGQLVINVTQLVELALVVVSWWQIVRVVEPGDLAATAWRVLLAGAALYLLGQAIWTSMLVAVGPDNIPYPSPIDVAFLVGQLLVTVGFVLHFVAYARTGLPLGRWASYAPAVVVAVAFPGTAIARIWIDPAIEEPIRYVATCYLGIDVGLLCGAFFMLRLSMLLRGGTIAIVWGMIAAGAVLWATGDTLFFFGSEHMATLVYFWAFAMLACGALRHREIILDMAGPSGER